MVFLKTPVHVAAAPAEVWRFLRDILSHPRECSGLGRKMFEPLNEVRVAIDLWRAHREGAQGLARRQAQRLAALVAYARTRSPFYRHLYHDLPAEHVVLRDLPRVTKPELMAAFDDWVTDPAITRTGIDVFIADSARAGEAYLGRYFVCTSSGTTGRPGVFVHDSTAMAVYHAAFEARPDYGMWLTRRALTILCRRGLRFANIFGTGGHFAGVGLGEARVAPVSLERTELPHLLRAATPARTRQRA